MRGTEAPARPLARADRLIVRELPDELLIYDLDREKAHCLNRAAALVWQNCDGRASVAELARRLARETSAPVDEQLVWFALKQLDRDHLLVDGVALPAQVSGVTRRQMIRALGISAAVALPLVTTILAPTPAQASTCGGTGAPCTGSEQCCPGSLCVNGHCA